LSFSAGYSSLTRDRCVMLQVRRCTPGDIATLRKVRAERLRHHEEQFAAQERGWCDYLLALDDRGRLVGHTVVRMYSKYERVIDSLGRFPEVNGLAAYPTGHGTGSALLDASVQVAEQRGASMIGLAVERSNVAARRLYERHGFVDWGHGEVVDDWEELADDGDVLALHHDVCAYLVLALADGSSHRSSP
jgi:GNAT superfamily N-acetyltransferase